MKKTIITLAILTSMSSAMAVADEAKADIDMSDPTDVYTTVGLSYGDAGLDFKGMLMLSSTETQKTGLIFEAKNMLDEDSYDAPDFNKGMAAVMGGATKEVSSRSYRLRWGTINTQNGLGWSIDAVSAEHPVYGQLTAVQTGPNMTIPIGDNFLIWPIAYVGGVILEDTNIEGLISQGGQSDPMTTDGVNIASAIVTGMVYARYAITDQLWALGSYSYTTDIQGKSWSDDIMDGGLQMANAKYDLTIGYQFTPRQNVTLIYTGDDSGSDSDTFAVGYNYAF
ncbi:MAG: hypothetical protein QNK26_04375 [Moritella sp.]|uniref:hypothetical protein n=1 Tax=Moritella sp. TaxID=78556 RepID=UPI0029B1F687|nr:hypothetical protein [Moritella sp.]MDX2319814.1 hypothetical protein [Moritella sp.]